MSFDARAPMLCDFHMADLMPHASALDWMGDRSFGPIPTAVRWV